MGIFPDMFVHGVQNLSKMTDLLCRMPNKIVLQRNKPQDTIKSEIRKSRRGEAF